MITYARAMAASLVEADRPKPGVVYPSLRDNLQAIPEITYTFEDFLNRRFNVRTFRALAACGDRVAAIARSLCVSEDTVKRWVDEASARFAD